MNQLPAPANVSARFAWLEAPGVGYGTAWCGRELFSNTSVGVVTGGLTLELLSLDGAALPTASGRGGKRGGYQPRQPSKAAAKDRALKRKVIRKRK